jgi:ADP-ribosyl-[dinitrogen reductase] hydrolase
MDQIKAALFGLSVGDALGVPVEFRDRAGLRNRPITDMTGYGTHNQPPGTWSDDSSMAFCLAEALTTGFDLKLIASHFIDWRYNNFWTPHGVVFDIGNTTDQAIYRLKQGVAPTLAGGFFEDDNGNGSLMRILPLLFYHKDKTNEERFELTKAVSSITHGHMCSVIACFYYLEFARLVLLQKDKLEIYRSLQETLPAFLKGLQINPDEIAKFKRLLHDDIHFVGESSIHSSGYVLSTLEASIWCILTTDNYSDAVLKSVNLGSDTDTTGAVTGGLAGLIYGLEGIPSNWIDGLARRKDINDLAERLSLVF